MSEKEIPYKRKNSTFPNLMHQHQLEDGQLSMIQANSALFPAWIFAVEERIEKIEKQLRKKQK